MSTVCELPPTSVEYSFFASSGAMSCRVVGLEERLRFVVAHSTITELSAERSSLDTLRAEKRRLLAGWAANSSSSRAATGRARFIGLMPQCGS